MWKPIETLELKEKELGARKSAVVLLWVQGGFMYTGPVIGYIEVYTRERDGEEFKNLRGKGFGGYEWEWDFDVKDITHWAELPEPPSA